MHFNIYTQFLESAPKIMIYVFIIVCAILNSGIDNNCVNVKHKFCIF